MSKGNVIDWQKAKRRSRKAKSSATETTRRGATVERIGEAPSQLKNSTDETLRHEKRPRAANEAKAARRRRARGLTLCRAGRHRWEVDNSRPFDVAAGKLVTRRRCRHCGKTRVDLD